MRQKAGGSKPKKPNAEQIALWFQEWKQRPRQRQKRRPMPTPEHCRAIADYLSPPPNQNYIETYDLPNHIVSADVQAFGDLFAGRMKEVLDQAGRLKSSLVNLNKFLLRNGIPESEFDPNIIATLKAVEAMITDHGPARGGGRPRNRHKIFEVRLKPLCERALRESGWPANVSGSGPDGPVTYVIKRILEHV